ncbi:hypothetical protein ASG19_06775 [Rhizobium sp. Leaf306]|uniref:hypothetical protein n=1 Tax=Rhizobium sp. Leaf306 TaxID=1736330 RepID=UPI000712ED87|nr:hypothetical protein [Rhizobium sp. Leaf306]KQQ38717.1 hypothetical protein ASG19_06775 [Rhizobium sp. Leaf306]
MKRFQWPLLGIVTLWLTLAIYFKWSRAGCGRIWSEACTGLAWQRFGDFITLGWISSYQDLLAGLAALAGGASVVMAYQMQARDAKRHRDADARDDALAACSIASQRFIDIGSSLSTMIIGPNSLSTEFIVAQYKRLAYIDSMLATITIAQVREIESFNPVRGGDELGLIADTYALARILQYAGDNLDAEGRFPLKTTADIPPGMLNNGRIVQRAHMGVLRSFFDWSNTSD